MTIFPDSTNTGVPDGVTLLASGSISIDKPGVVIKGLDIKGTVYINADNVTLEDCKVTTPAFYAVKVSDGVTGAIVQDCEINGVGTGNDGSIGIGGQGTFLRNDIYNVENGMAIQGDNSLIKDNYIHDLKASGSPHYDGIQIDGNVNNATLSHNTIINDYGQTAAVMISNYFGDTTNIKVDDNLLVGGGYTVYSDGHFTGGTISGVSFTNNHLGQGQWGYSSIVNNTPVWQNNATDGHTLADTLDHQVGTTPPPVVTEPPTETPPPPPPPTDSGPLNGTSGNDLFTAKAGAESFSGSYGFDTVSYANATAGLTANMGSPGANTGFAAGDKYASIENLTGSNYSDVLTGDSKGNVLEGLGGNDKLSGGGGNDTLTGGMGQDTMTGGSGGDRFDFNTVSQIGSSPSTRDIITDFVSGKDKIDLSSIDANGSSYGDTAFKFIAGEGSSFDHTKGVIAWNQDDHWGTANDITVVQGDIDGDGVHDFEIQLTGLVQRPWRGWRRPSKVDCYPPRPPFDCGLKNDSRRQTLAPAFCVYAQDEAADASWAKCDPSGFP
jgi:Ca2+-binding RTX toxin-like protein